MEKDEHLAEHESAIDSEDVPARYVPIFERGAGARLRGKAIASHKYKPPSEKYWRQGWDAADRLLKASQRPEKDGRKTRASVSENKLAALRDRRDRWRLMVEVVMALGGVGAFVSAFFLWAQVQQQAADTLSVRRAQLLATIYEEECDPEDASSDEKPDDGEMTKDATGEVWRATSRNCRPRAPLRARQEAALAFVQIERGSSLVQPNLGEAKLNRANLSRADLSKVELTNADLSGANLYVANLSRAILLGANLSGANLSRADLSGAFLNYGDLNAADLIKAVLNMADLSGADFRGADLRDADLTSADLIGANLSRADLSGANLREADLSKANLSEAVLTRATLREAEFTWAELDGTMLGGADLQEAKYLTQTQIDAAQGDADTKLPAGLSHPANWLENKE